MRGFRLASWRYLDLRLLFAGSALLLAALYMMHLESRNPYAQSARPPFVLGVSHPAALLSASMFLLGWLLLWSVPHFSPGIARRVLLGLALYLLTGIAVRGITPYTPLWSPPGFRREVLDRLAGWLSWPRYVSGAPVSGFGASEVGLLLVTVLYVAWLFRGHRWYSPT